MNDIGCSESTKVLDAPEDFVGNNSTQRVNASIITRIWVHWEIDYRIIIGIYRNFTTVSEVFFELIATLRPFKRCFGS